MRFLAIARWRVLTTIRSATLLFVAAVIVPFAAAAAQSAPFTPDASMMNVHAAMASYAWLIHAAFLLFACETFGNVGILRADFTPATDLLESAPLRRMPRFFGEAAGVFSAAAILHICCLPLLVTAAVLSPAATSIFVSIEAAVLALLILASASAAWKRLAPVSKWSRTRTVRSLALFFVLVLLSVIVTTQWALFRDAMFAFLVSPSMRAWTRVASAVDNPFPLALLLVVLYCSYLLFYFVQGTREPEQA